MYIQKLKFIGLILGLWVLAAWGLIDSLLCYTSVFHFQQESCIVCLNLYFPFRTDLMMFLLISRGWKTVVCATLCNNIYCFFVERNWKTGQPDNWNHGHGPGEDCAGLIYAGLWNDFYCEDVNNFICEKDMDKGKQGIWFDYFTLYVAGQIQVHFAQIES